MLRRFVFVGLLTTATAILLPNFVLANLKTPQGSLKDSLKVPQVIASPNCNVEDPPPVCVKEPPPAPPPASHFLNVPLFPQKTSMWCWAASGQMVMRFVDPSVNVTQCAQANVNFGRSDCCNSPTPDACVNGGWQVFNNFGFTFTSQSNALTWNRLISLLNQGKPVMFAWAWNGGGGHMMVARGWRLSQGKKYVSINDPWPPNVGDRRLITYTAWVGGVGQGHTHWADFYDIRRQTSGVKPLSLPLETKPSNQAAPAIPSQSSPLIAANSVEEQPAPVNPEALTKLTISPKVQERATQSVETVRNAVRESKSPEDLRDLGFESISEAESVALGRPIQEYTIGLDQLRSFAPQQNPIALLTRNSTTLYPLVSNQKIVSSVRISRTGQTADIESIGNATLIRMIASLGQTNYELRKSSQPALAAIRIPALGLYLLARQEGGVLKVTSVFDVPDLKLTKGRYEPAADVFSRITKKLSTMNNLPM